MPLALHNVSITLWHAFGTAQCKHYIMTRLWHCTI